MASAASLARTLARRGEFHRLRGDAEGAIADFDRAIKLDPKHARSYLLRGFLWRARGYPERALAAFQDALVLNPNYAWARAEAGRTKIDVGRGDEVLVPSLTFVATSNVVVHVGAMPIFVEHATLGFATGVVALIAGAGYGVLVVGQLSAVREFDAGRQQGRFIAAAATYLVAFALFALVFLFGVPQQPASLAVGLASMLLAAEILREGEIDPAETLLYSLVAGVVVAETRWLIHYLPVDAYAGALALLLAFYLVTGVLHSHVVRQFSRSVATTYAQVGVAGVAFIAVVRALGVA